MSPPKIMPHRYFIYARKSSEDKKRQIQSIDDQRRELLMLAQQRGLNVVDTICDERSAKSPGRVGFSSMIKRLQAKEADGILCWKLDRLARNPIDGGSITWLLQQEVIQEIVTPEKTYYPKDNAILMGIEFGMANQYIIDLRNNVKRGMTSKIDKGWMPTRAPLGYRNEVHADKGTKKILPDPELFPVIQKLWHLLLTGKYSLARLYDHMKEQCPILIQGKLIYFSSFHRLFHNKFYCGVFQWKEQEHLGAHQAMISQSEFQKVQTIINKTPEIRQRKLTFDFKGIFRCGVCNSMITAETHKKVLKTKATTKNYNYYKCPRHKRTIICREKPIAETKLEAQLQAIVQDISLPVEIIDLALAEIQKLPAENEASFKEKQIKTAVAQLDQKIATAIEILSTEPDAEIRIMVKENINRLKIQRQALQEDLHQTTNAESSCYQEITDNLSVVRAAQEILRGDTEKEKRQLLTSLGSNWIVAQQKIDYKPYFTTKALQESKKFYLGVQSPVRTRKNGLRNTQDAVARTAAFFWSG